MDQGGTLYIIQGRRIRAEGEAGWWRKGIGAETRGASQAAQAHARDGQQL